MRSTGSGMMTRWWLMENSFELKSRCHLGIKHAVESLATCRRAPCSDDPNHPLYALTAAKLRSSPLPTIQLFYHHLLKCISLPAVGVKHYCAFCYQNHVILALNWAVLKVTIPIYTTPHLIYILPQKLTDN